QEPRDGRAGRARCVVCRRLQGVVRPLDVTHAVSLARSRQGLGFRPRMHADLVLFGRIVLAAVLGYAVGWEREYRKSTAGDRTFALVAIGAAGITGIGAEFYPASAEKVIAGVVTGLGFLGAGII